MTVQSIQQFFTVPALNTDISGIDVNTNWPTTNVGPAFRTLMSFLANSLQPLALPVGGQTAVTLSAAEAATMFLGVTGALTATCTITFPGNLFVGFIENATSGGYNVILTTGSGATVTLPPNSGWVMYEINAGNVTLVGSLGNPLASSPVTASTSNAVTDKIAVTVNGTTYYLLASTSGT